MKEAHAADLQQPSAVAYVQLCLSGGLHEQLQGGLVAHSCG